MVFPHRQVLHRAVMRHDPWLGQRYVASATVRVPHERGCYWIRTNAQGFRADEDFTLARRDRRPRVLVLGDSFTAGDGVDNSERFTAHLGRRLGLDVHNLALSGAGADQLVLVLEQMLPELRPDLVVLAPSVHTIQRVLLPHRDSRDRLGRDVRLPRPHFLLEGEHLVLRGVPVEEAGEPIAAPPSAAQLVAPWRVACADAADRALGQRGRGVRDELRGVARGALRRALQRFTGWEADPHYADPDDGAWRLLARILTRFHEVAHGVPVVIVPLPTPSYVADRLSPRFTARFAALDDPARGLHVVDVTAALQSAPRALRRDYAYARDPHPSPVGHKAIAEALSRALVERRLVPGVHSPASDEARGGTVESATAAVRATDSRPATLEIGFTSADACARIVRDGSASAAVWESDVAREYTCPGALPFAALAQVLETEGLDGRDLSRIVMLAPEPWEDVLQRAVSAPGSADDLAAHVRWTGAAERDVRRLLRFSGPIVHGLAAPDTVATARRTVADAASASDPEWLWLRRELSRLLASGGSPEARRSAFQGLSARWERATRRARYSCFP